MGLWRLRREAIWGLTSRGEEEDDDDDDDDDDDNAACIGFLHWEFSAVTGDRALSSKKIILARRER